MKTADYIVVGQGLAGSILALELLNQGQKVMVLNTPNPQSASRVAAGIYHPLVFKRTTLTWLASTLLDYIETYYPKLETQLKAKFFYPMPYIRLFASDVEQTIWQKFKGEDEYKSFLGDLLNEIPSGYKDKLGGAIVNKAGWVDTNTFLDKVAQYLEVNNSLINEPFEYDVVEFSNTGVVYKGITAKKILFAEGYGVVNNPYFKYTPLSPTKGELFTIKAEGLAENQILNRKVFVLPLGNNTYKVGATYQWQWSDENATQEMKNQLIENLESLINVPYTILSHTAGVRPSVIGRRPLIGLHPQHPQLGIFNGMGSKGVMLAPYLAQQFVNNLLHNGLINNEVDIARLNT